MAPVWCGKPEALHPPQVTRNERCLNHPPLGGFCVGSNRCLYHIQSPHVLKVSFSSECELWLYIPLYPISLTTENPMIPLHQNYIPLLSQYITTLSPHVATGPLLWLLELSPLSYPQIWKGRVFLNNRRPWPQGPLNARSPGVAPGKASEVYIELWRITTDSR